MTNNFTPISATSHVANQELPVVVMADGSGWDFPEMDAETRDALIWQGRTKHHMLGGSHERPNGPECVCGKEWDWWNDKCMGEMENSHKGVSSVADFLPGDSDDWPSVNALIAVAESNIERTNQQRIANLIAVAAWHDFEDTDVIAEIRKGLGL